MGTRDIGLKEAQYYLGFMYLKGQHVQQSVGLGMAWRVKLKYPSGSKKIQGRQPKSYGSLYENRNCQNAD